MKKAINLAVVLLFALSISVVTAYSENVFDDVPPDYWASTEIQRFADNNIVNGIGNNLFDPESMVTREQLCKIMVLTFKVDLDGCSEQIFSDVEPNRWSFSYINKCKDFLTGYINPFGGLPSYRPEEYATREDIAVALVRIMGVTENGYEEKYNIAPTRNFTDADDVSPRLRKYVVLAHKYELIYGYPDGSFRPKAGVTRAEAVVLLDRATKQAYADMVGDLSDPNIPEVPDDSTSVNYINTPQERTVLTLHLSYPAKSATDTITVYGAAEENPVSDSYIKIWFMNGNEIFDVVYLTNGVEYNEVIKVVPADKVVEGNSFSKVINLMPGMNSFKIESYSANSNIVYDNMIVEYQAH